MSDGISGVPTGYTSNGGGGDQQTTRERAKRGVFIARVLAVFVKDGTHRVRFASKEHNNRPEATVLMPFLSPDGLGFLAGIRKNTACLVVSSSLEGEYFVIGFFSDDPASLYAGPVVQPGDLHLASSGGAVVSAMASGDVNIHAHDLCGMSLFQEDQKFSVVDRTFEHKHAGGRLTWGEATEDDGAFSEGDTWRKVEVRRERGKPPTLTHIYGNAKASDGAELISQREITDELGQQLLLEEIKTDGTITITHPNGARFRMQADGNVFVEPKLGGTIHMNDPGRLAMGSARINDFIEDHDHEVTITRAGPFVVNVEVEDHEQIKIATGSAIVKVG